jgi:hypothetical protein
VAISHGIALESFTPQRPLGRGIHALQGWLQLGEVSHVPHLLDLDGLVDLDDLGS